MSIGKLGNKINFEYNITSHIVLVVSATVYYYTPQLLATPSEIL